MTSVRHPFVRLFSTYQDQVGKSGYFKELRNIFTNQNDTYRNPSFSAFVDLLISEKTLANNLQTRGYIQGCAMCNTE